MRYTDAVKVFSGTGLVHSLYNTSSLLYKGCQGICIVVCMGWFLYQLLHTTFRIHICMHGLDVRNKASLELEGQLGTVENSMRSICILCKTPAL